MQKLDYQKIKEDHLKQEIAQLQSEACALEQNIGHMKKRWEKRKYYLEEEITSLQMQRERCADDLNEMENPNEDREPPPPGPVSLRWVDGDRFTVLCNGVIIVNLITMILELRVPRMTDALYVPNQIFLAFYVLELSLKLNLHHLKLLFGPPSRVWWNWLDLVIVMSGIFDQWLAPIVMLIVGHEHGVNLHTGGLRILRLLRLVRVVRVLKVVKVFLHSDFSWTEGPAFQMFITSVIAANGVILGLELDYHSRTTWYWVEQTMLVIYFFELGLRFKREGLYFFINADWGWNNLDFLIVASSVFDQWLMPTMEIFQNLIYGPEEIEKSHNASLLPLLRMLRLLRILRLIRVLKSFKPLYKLAIGIMQAMQAMQWVVVLTLLLLYTCAILFRSLVGHGLMPGTDVSPEARKIYSSVFESFFLLFWVMNGDQEPFEPLFSAGPLKILCILFVVVSNWAVLAILTAVVSENMISATEDHEEQEQEENEIAARIDRKARLTTLFKEVDKDGDGFLDRQEFAEMMRDNGLREELCSTSHLTECDLNDLFDHLSTPGDDGMSIISYGQFIEKLQFENKQVSERSFFRLEKQMRLLEARVEQKLMHMQDKLHCHHNINYIFDDEGNAKVIRRVDPFWRA